MIVEKLDAASGRYTWWAPASVNDSGYIRIKDSYDNSNTAISGLIYISSPSSINDEKIPEEYYLAQNYPNPFNPMTNVDFGLPESSHVSLDLFDTTGRRIKNILSENLNPGHYSIQLLANDLASGIYFCQLTTAHYMSVKKLTYLK
jgi:hypothetical protein